MTLYAKENPSALRCLFLEPPAECRRPDISFTIDRRHEYEHVREIANSFPGIDFSLQSLIAVADEMVGAIR